MSLLNSTQYIKQVSGHYEAYTEQSGFICSGDTFEECSEELLNLIKAEAKTLQPIIVSV